LAAEPGAKIAAGFREPITPERMRETGPSGEILDLLEYFEARPGDTFFIPAGVVHGIGEGLTLCEIQQHSDITYRIYDYDRPRPLQLEEAIAVSRFDRHAARQSARDGVLVSCPFFITEKHTGPLSADGAWVVGLEGEGSVDGESLRPGDVFL